MPNPFWIPIHLRHTSSTEIDHRDGGYFTVKVPYIPAWRWPGASQKKV